MLNKPWENDETQYPDSIYVPKGMIADEERRCLYWLAGKVYKGTGKIVDAGAYLGASAFCLAAGASWTNPPSAPIVHSYDYFKAVDQYVVDHISREIRPIELNQSYADIFASQTGEFSRLIKSHPGDFLEQKWSGEPIEILFIDIAKTRKLNSHVVSEFFPSLMPGHSIVVQQDFYHIPHPYIHVTMEYLRPYFTILDAYVANQSRVYRLDKKIPPHVLWRVAEYRFNTAEKLTLLRRSAAHSTSPVKEMLEAIIVYQCVLDKDAQAYVRERDNFVRQHPDVKHRFDLWAVQFMNMDSWAAHDLNVPKLDA